MSDKPKSAAQLQPMDFNGAEYESSRYIALVETGVPPERVLEPDYWTHHAAKLKPWDYVEARAKDGTWMTELRVLDCSRTWARMKQMTFTRMTTGDVSMTQASADEITKAAAAYKVVHRGPRGWSVVRQDPERTVVHEQEATKDGAEDWLKKHAEQEVRGPLAVTTA